VEPSVIPELARRIVIAFLLLTHIQFAAFLIGIFSIAVALEFFSLLATDSVHLRRVSHGLGKTATLIYSTGAVLAFSVMFILAIFFPIFWYTIQRINFWPFFLEALTFVLTVLYLFPWFFTWRSLENFRWVHLSLGGALIIAAYFQQSLIDVIAAYMLTSVPAEQLLRVFFTPTTIPLDMHRILGDVSFAGFVLAGYASVRALRSRDEADRAYFDWFGSLALLAGLAFMFLQPAVGVEYLEEIRADSPGGFNVMMRGPNAWLFLVQVAVLSVLFLLGVYYMLLQVRKSGHRSAGTLRAMLWIGIISALLLVQPRVIGPGVEHPWVAWENPLGTMQPWKYLAMGGLTLSGIIAVGAYLGAYRRGLRWGYFGDGGRRAQRVLLTLAIFASLMMLLMGFIRENSRLPFVIYYQQQLSQPERFPQLQVTPTPVGPASQRSSPGTP